jgi:FHS family L-fucose permease-like MFS transporter
MVQADVTKTSVSSDSNPSSRLNLTQAFNSVGTTIVPYVGGLLILAAVLLSSTQLEQLSAPALVACRQHEASSLKVSFIGVALALIALALAVAMFSLPKIEATREFRPMGEVALLPEPD